MAKKFKDLMEATGDIVKNIMGPTDIRELKTLSRQLTSSFHQSIPMVFAKIEAKLNWFGYTLGELDLEDDMPPVGSENLFILSKADEEIVKNVYIIVKWEKMATGVSGGASDLRPDGSALRWAIDVETKEIAPDKLASMLGDTLADEDDGTSFWNKDEDFEAEEGNLETADSEAEYQDDEYKEGAYAYNESVDIHNLGLGDRVTHAKHGAGVVAKVTEKPEVHVKFKTGTKKFHKGNAHELNESLDESFGESHREMDKRWKPHGKEFPEFPTNGGHMKAAEHHAKWHMYHNKKASLYAGHVGSTKNQQEKLDKNMHHHDQMAQKHKSERKKHIAAAYANHKPEESKNESTEGKWKPEKWTVGNPRSETQKQIDDHEAHIASHKQKITDFKAGKYKPAVKVDLSAHHQEIIKHSKAIEKLKGNVDESVEDDIRHELNESLNESTKKFHLFHRGHPDENITNLGKHKSAAHAKAKMNHILNNYGGNEAKDFYIVKPGEDHKLAHAAQLKRLKTKKESLEEGVIDHEGAREHMGMIDMHAKKLAIHKHKPLVAKFHADQIAYHAGELAKHHQARSDAGVDG